MEYLSLWRDIQGNGNSYRRGIVYTPPYYREGLRLLMRGSNQSIALDNGFTKCVLYGYKPTSNSIYQK